MHNNTTTSENVSGDNNYSEFEIRSQRLRSSLNSRRSETFDHEGRLSREGRPPSRSRSEERTMDIHSPSSPTQTVTSAVKQPSTSNNGVAGNPLGQAAAEKPRRLPVAPQKSNSSNELLPSTSKEKGQFHTLPRSRKRLQKEIEVSCVRSCYCLSCYCIPVYCLLLHVLFSHVHPGAKRYMGN